jgi:hypothetical protein
MDVAVLRERYASIVNHELEAAGLPGRYDHRTYDQMSIDQEPAVDLGAKLGALVKARVYVAADLSNARKSWDARGREVARELDAEQTRYDAVIARAKQTLQKLSESALSVSDQNLQARARELVEHASLAMEGRRALSELGLLRDIAESAAKRLQRTCERLLAAIAEGRASKADVRSESDIRRRLQLTQRHLAEIADMIEPYHASIDAYRAEILTHKAQADELADSVADMTGAIKAARDAETTRRETALREQEDRRAWAENTVLPVEHYPRRLSRHDHFNALVEHIRSENAVMKEQPVPFAIWQLDGGAIVVPSLKEADDALLADDVFKRRFAAAFTSEIEHQSLAVGRVLSHVKTHGTSGLTSRPDDTATRPRLAIINLYARYKNHPQLFVGLPAAQQHFESARERDQVAHDSTISQDQPVQTPAQQSKLHSRVTEKEAGSPNQASGRNISSLVAWTRRAAVEGHARRFRAYLEVRRTADLDCAPDPVTRRPIAEQSGS